MSDASHITLSDDERTRCEVWTRVMGYHRPVAAFNAGKQSEHAERTYYSEQPQAAGAWQQGRRAAA
ncbi:MAG: hypothetical protein EA400_02415 [Chromatiaceae bacterium]|nr:MAG: hypothetical protein EA400_02415 [Chromatiaceae bacterium]